MGKDNEGNRECKRDRPEVQEVQKTIGNIKDEIDKNKGKADNSKVKVP